MEKHPLIRAIYLYLFTIIGLVLLVIGSVRFIDMGLKAFIFTAADEAQRISQKYYGMTSPMLPIAAEKMQLIEENTKLTDEEIASIKQWAADYKTQQEEMTKIDYVKSERQRDASTNLAMILVGLPLYLYHWSLIKKDAKKYSEVKEK